MKVIISNYPEELSFPAEIEEKIGRASCRERV